VTCLWLMRLKERSAESSWRMIFYPDQKKDGELCNEDPPFLPASESF
jgi:hypothetical protein